MKWPEDLLDSHDSFLWQPQASRSFPASALDGAGVRNTNTVHQVGRVQLHSLGASTSNHLCLTACMPMLL